MNRSEREQVALEEKSADMSTSEGSTSPTSAEAAETSHNLLSSGRHSSETYSSKTPSATTRTETTTMLATITEAVKSDDHDQTATTVAAALVPIFVLGTMLGLLLMWCRKKRRRASGSSQQADFFGKWRGTTDGTPSSPHSAEMAWNEKADCKRSGSSQRQEAACPHPRPSRAARMVEALSPGRKCDRSVSSRHAQNKKKSRSVTHHIHLKDTISGPSNFEHRSTSKKESQRLLADQLNAVSSLEGPSSDPFDTPLPPYTGQATVGRSKPAPLCLSAAVEVGRAMVLHSEKERQKASMAAPSRPRPAAAPVHKRKPSSRTDVPKILQPRVRSLRRKPIPLAPLPRAPGEGEEALKDQESASAALGDDSPVDRPMSRTQTSRSASSLRPESTSTFFCQGPAEAPPATAEEKSQAEKQASVKKLSVPVINTRFSFFSAATTAEPEAKCKAPPNSLAGSAFKPEDDDNAAGQTYRRSARESMFDKMRKTKAVEEE